MEKKLAATLRLANGREFKGLSFGYTGSCSGEVVFSTAMCGYPESLTDPSYEGQILCLTYPCIGNYGIPSAEQDEYGIAKNFESDRIHVKGLVITDYSEKYSHWSAVKSLDEWMKEEKIPGIYDIDTRELTKVLRENGSMTGVIIPEGVEEAEVYDPDKENQVAKVSCSEVIRYGNGAKKVVALDCGLKNQVIRTLVRRGVEVVRVPYDYDFNTLEYDGLFISSGPGNPDFCDAAIANIAKAIEAEKTVFGICLGNLLLAKAAGAKTFKLKYGHHSHNQPVRLEGTNRCFITNQNHCYCVDNDTLPSDWEVYCTNMNDGTNEGIRHKSKPFYAVQFLPETAEGTTDTGFLFDDFVNKL